jgi:hypothetical protein
VRALGHGILFCGPLESFFRFNADGKDILVFARSPEHLVEVCDVVLRLLAVSTVHTVILSNWDGPSSASIYTNTFAFMMEQCQSLRALTFGNGEAMVTLSEDHCGVLGANSRPGLEIELKQCQIPDAAAIVLAQVLGRNQGPTKLDLWYIDNSILADGLRGNSRLRSLVPCLFTKHGDSSQGLLAIADALRENKGLVHLDFKYGLSTITNKAFYALCDSLKTHPTLKVLTFLSGGSPAAIIMSRMQALVDMMKVNISIHKICFRDDSSEQEIFRRSVLPYLDTNRLRPRVRAIQKTRPISYRAKVLGRALLATSTDTNSFWMLLSGNAEVAFPSTIATTAAAVNLPTPAAANASTDATASTTAASNAIVPPVGQKRKACP